MTRLWRLLGVRSGLGALNRWVLYWLRFSIVRVVDERTGAQTGWSIGKPWKPAPGRWSCDCGAAALSVGGPTLPRWLHGYRCPHCRCPLTSEAKG